MASHSVCLIENASWLTVENVCRGKSFAKLRSTDHKIKLTKTCFILFTKMHECEFIAASNPSVQLKRTKIDFEVYVPQYGPKHASTLWQKRSLDKTWLCCQHLSSTAALRNSLKESGDSHPVFLPQTTSLTSASSNTSTFQRLWKVKDSLDIHLCKIDVDGIFECFQAYICLLSVHLYKTTMLIIYKRSTPMSHGEAE